MLPPILLGTSASVGFSIQGGPESGPHEYWGTTVHINYIWRWIHTYAYRTNLLSVCREQRKPLAFLGQWPWSDFITSCAPLSNPSFWISSASVLWLHGQESSTASQAMSFPVGCSVPGKGRWYPSLILHLPNHRKKLVLGEPGKQTEQLNKGSNTPVSHPSHLLIPQLHMGVCLQWWQNGSLDSAVTWVWLVLALFLYV